MNEDYDLDGDGAADTSREDACSISFWGIGAGLAREVDAALDGQMPSVDWMDSGRASTGPRSTSCR